MSAGWTATFVRAAVDGPVLLRTTVRVPEGVTGARVRTATRGVHQVSIDGRDIDDEVLKPGWVAYTFRTPWRVDDVSSLVRPGAATLEVRLAGGWFTEDFGHIDNVGHRYGTRPEIAVELEVDLADGTSRVLTDSRRWEWTRGPIRASGLYDGEEADARVLPSGWQPAIAGEPERLEDPGPLPAPVRRRELLDPVSIDALPGGRWLLDFGQNLVGRLRLRGSAEPGRTVTLRHAEVLEHGELSVRPLRRALATDVFVFAGAGEESWEPEFTFHGFRYVEVGGWPGRPAPGSLRAVVLHSDLERTGVFRTSHPLLDRFHENVVWSARGNFLSVPSDCPQRDERLGWTGDIQAFVPTAAFLFDCREFLASWLHDLALEQRARDGVVPVIVPDPIRDISTPVAAWGDAATIVPWTLYERFGDAGILRDAYGSMRDWVLAVERATTDGLWVGDFQFGDWLDPSAPPDDPGRALTDPDLVATAYLHRSASILAATAGILGEEADAAAFGRLAERVRGAFRSEYVTARARLVSDTPTAYALALCFGLLDEAERHPAGDRLAELVRARRHRVSTGFVGTSLVCDALADTGHGDDALRLLLQTEGPSWLHPVTLGATTIWERWDSLLEDGSVNPGEMTSFNHYALGAVADFIHRWVAGLAPAAPGYARLRIAPLLGPGLDDAAAELASPHGRIAVGWRREPGGRIRVSASIPDGVTADVALPGMPEVEAGPGEHAWLVDVPALPRSVLDGLSTPMRDLAVVPEAVRRVLDVLERADPDRAASLARQSTWSTRRPVGEAIATFAPEVRARVAEALAPWARSGG